MRTESDDGGDINTGQFQSNPLSTRNVAREDILIERRERDRGDLLVGVLLGDRVEYLQRGEFHLDLEILMKLHEPPDVHVKVTGERKQTGAPWTQPLGPQRERQTAVVGDGRRHVDRRPRRGIRQMDVAHGDVHCRKRDAINSCQFEPADRGIEQRPLTMMAPSSWQSLGKHSKGQIDVGGAESLATARVACGTDERMGVLDTDREGIDVDFRSTDKCDIATGGFKGEVAHHVGNSQQLDGRIATRGERLPLHIERDRNCWRRIGPATGSIAEQNWCKRVRRLRPVDRPAVVTDHSGGVDHHRSIGHLRRKSVDAD